eukprot:266189-Ditylum_brightwellii.AAC.1
MLEKGLHWPLKTLEFESRKKDLKEAFAFRNHKGATRHPDLLHKLISKDAKHGYGLLIPLGKIKMISSAVLVPMNRMQQKRINKTGMITEKDRFTHNQSYEWSEGKSVNIRVDKEALLPCKFGDPLDEGGLQIGLQKRPPECRNSNTNLHTTPRWKLSDIITKTHLQRITGAL